MYKKVCRNVVKTWNNGILKISLRNSSTVFLVNVNNVQTHTIPKQFFQRKYYHEFHNSLVNTMKNEKNNREEDNKVDEVKNIIIYKDDEAAKKKIEEFCKDPESDKIYKSLELQLEWWRQENRQIPDEIRPYQMLELLRLTPTKKMKYLMYLFRIEKRAQTEQQEKIEAQKELEELRAKKKEAKANKTSFDITQYNLSNNTMFVRIYDITMNAMYNNNVMKSMMFGNTIVLDCSYNQYMTSLERMSLAKQIMFTIAKNRIHDRPFNIYLCNYNKETEVAKQLNKFIPTLYNEEYPINITEDSYLDLFDKKNLCYLTPHCRTELQEYDPNTIYVLGAFVDKSERQPISLAKAKREKIRMAKFPLELFLDWGAGSSKNLTVNSCVEILLDLQVNNSWEKAMKHIPHRKLKTTREYVEKHNLKPNSEMVKVHIKSIKDDYDESTARTRQMDEQITNESQVINEKEKNTSQRMLNVSPAPKTKDYDDIIKTMMEMDEQNSSQSKTNVNNSWQKEREKRVVLEKKLKKVEEKRFPKISSTNQEYIEEPIFSNNSTQNATLNDCEDTSENRYSYSKRKKANKNWNK